MSVLDQSGVPESERSRRSQPRGERTRERLLLAAWSLFAEHGYEGTSIGDVAQEAGVGVGTVYHHFADKRALLLDTVNHYERTPLVEGSGGGSGALELALQEEDVPRALVAVCRLAVEMRCRYPSVYGLARELGRRDAEFAACCARIDASHRGRLRADIEAGQRSGKVRADVDPEAGAQIVHALLRASLQEIGASPEDQREVRIEALASMIGRYLLVD
jgi:AcrR family transcriptional regulator